MDQVRLGDAADKGADKGHAASKPVAAGFEHDSWLAGECWYRIPDVREIRVNGANLTRDLRSIAAVGRMVRFHEGADKGAWPGYSGRPQMAPWWLTRTALGEDWCGRSVPVIPFVSIEGVDAACRSSSLRFRYLARRGRLASPNRTLIVDQLRWRRRYGCGQRSRPLIELTCHKCVNLEGGLLRRVQRKTRLPIGRRQPLSKEPLQGLS